MEDKELIRNIELAGDWFLGEYAMLVIENYYNLMNSKDYKSKFVKDLFKKSGYDNDYAATRLRVNSVLHIIESEKMVEALQYIINSDILAQEDPKAFEMAKDTLKILNS